MDKKENTNQFNLASTYHSLHSSPNRPAVLWSHLSTLLSLLANYRLPSTARAQFPKSDALRELSELSTTAVLSAQARVMRNAPSVQTTTRTGMTPHRPALV